MPFSEMRWPNTIPSFTMKWHFSQFSTKLQSSHLLRTSDKIGQTPLELITSHRKIIHKNFYSILHNVRKYQYHTSLKCGGCIAQPKRHSSEYKDPIWKSKSSFLLILWCNRNLIIPRISIKKTVPPFSGKSIQHLIHEGHRKWSFSVHEFSLRWSIHTLHPVTGLIGTSSFFSLGTTFIPAFLCTHWTGHT